MLPPPFWVPSGGHARNRGHKKGVAANGRATNSWKTANRKKELRDEVTIYGKRVERVKFRYLGRKLTADGQDVEEVKARMAAARGGMAQLMLPLHRRSAASARTKLAVCRTVSMAQLVYASQTWTLWEEEWKKVHVLEMLCLRRVLGWGRKMTENGVRYPKNEEVFREVGKVQ